MGELILRLVSLTRLPQIEHGMTRFQINWKLSGVQHLPIHSVSSISSPIFAVAGRRWRLTLSTLDDDYPHGCLSSLSQVDEDSGESDPLVQISFYQAAVRGLAT